MPIPKTHRGLRVYLSGGMEYAAGEGRDWRERMQEWIETELMGSVFNPNVESERFFSSRYPDVDFRAAKKGNPVLYREIVAHLVEIDCREIAERTDVCICYWDEGAARGAGTKGELTMARHYGKPVYLVTAIPFEEIPGWVIGCTDRFFDSFEELKAFCRTSPPATR